MMKIFKLIVLVSLTLTTFVSNGQNLLWLANGKKIEIAEFKIENKDYISYKTLKNKLKTIETFDVFSITPKNGNEIIIYSQDTSYQGSFNLLEMRDFVQGQSDAIQNFKSPLITAGGVGLAGAAPFALNPVFVILFSGAYCATIGLTKPIEKRLNIPMEYQNNEYYLLGYKKEVKHKRIRNSIIGSGIGLLAGFATYTMVNNK